VPAIATRFQPETQDQYSNRMEKSAKRPIPADNRPFMPTIAVTANPADHERNLQLNKMKGAIHSRH